MRRILTLTWLGLTDLPGYGPHPGIPAMGLFTAMPLSLLPDWTRVFICEGAIWLTFGMIFMIGSYQRAEAYLRHSLQENNRE